jgi:hypothetical protein
MGTPHLLPFVAWQRCHPDDSKGTKHRLICKGVENLAKKKGWNLKKVVLWVDYCGIEQDDIERKLAGVDSLRGYVTLCGAVLVPSPAVPHGRRTVDLVPGGYGEFVCWLICFAC